MDNTWGIHHFQPFRTASMCPSRRNQISGRPLRHPDRQRHREQDDDWHTLHATSRGLGQYTSPDDCWLTLRGSARWACGWRSRWIAASRWRTGWQAAGGEAGAAPCAARRAGPRDLEARFPGACSLFGVEFKPDYWRRARTLLSRRSTCSASARHGAASRAWRCRRPVRHADGGGCEFRGAADAAAYRYGGRSRSDLRSGRWAEGDAGVRARIAVDPRLQYQHCCNRPTTDYLGRMNGAVPCRQQCANSAIRRE